MKITSISDIHGKLPLATDFRNLILEDNKNVLIIAGDFLPEEKSFSSKEEIFHNVQLPFLKNTFMKWTKQLSFYDKIIITAGNHDFFDLSKENKILREILSDNDKISYLENSSLNYDGLNFYGTPYTYCPPKAKFWAFGKDEDRMYENAKSIPENTNILISHSPIYGCLDLGYSKNEGIMRNMGSKGYQRAFRETILQNLNHMLIGHIHENGGNYTSFTRLINNNKHVFMVHSCCISEDYNTNKPFVQILI